MRALLRIVFAVIFVIMSVVVVRTGFAMSLNEAWPSYAANPWAMATLWDVYCGFAIFYCWVLYKEPNWGPRLLWLVLIAGTGNIATSAYVLIELYRLRNDQPLESLLLRRK